MFTSIFKRINHGLNIRGREWPVLQLMLLYFFFVLCLHAVLKSVNTGLFLSVFDAAAYPWYFFAESILSFAISVSYNQWVIGKFNRQAENLGLFFFFIFVLLVGRSLLGMNLTWAFFVLPMFCDTLIGILVLQTWTLFGDCLNGRQAKRLFPLVGFGGTLGAICGGWIVSQFVEIIGTLNMLFVGMFLLVLLLLLTIIIVTRHVDETNQPLALEEKEEGNFKEKMVDFASEILQNRLLMIVILILVSVRVSSTIADYHLQVLLRNNFTQNSITSYMGTYFMITNICVLIIQGGIENRLISAYGVVFGMISTPISLFLGFSSFLLSPSLFSITCTKYFEHLTRNSVFKTASELVYLPFDSTSRRKLKLLVNALLGLATVPLVSFAIILMQGQTLALSLLALTFAFAGIILSIELRKPYTQKLHEALMQRQLLVEEDSKKSPIQSLTYERIQDTLLQEDTDMVLFTLGLLKKHQASISSENLLKLLDHAHPYVREGALHVLSQSADPDHIKAIQFILQSDKDPRVKQACFYAFRCLGDEELNPLALHYLEDSHLSVQAESVIFLFTKGGIEGVLAGAEHLKKLFQSEDIETLKTALYIIQEIGLRYFKKEFRSILSHPLPDIKIQAFKAVEKNAAPWLIPDILPYLESHTYAASVHNALGYFECKDLFPHLIKSFKHSKNRDYRIRLIQTFYHYPVPESFEVLLEMMMEPSIYIKHEALKVASRLRRKLNLDLTEYNHKIHYQLQRELRYGYSYYFLIRMIRKNPVKDRTQLLSSELQERIRFVERMIFRLLSLIYPPTEIYKAYLNFRSQDQHFKSLSLEVLNYMLSKDLSDVILTLLEDVPLSKKNQMGKERAYIDDYTQEAWWKHSMILEDPWLVSLGHWGRELPPENEKEKTMFDLLERIYLLKNTVIFKDFTVEEIQPVARVAKELVLPAQTSIFKRGTPGDAFYIIADGEVSITMNNKELATFKTFNCFGEMEILKASPRLATLKTKTPCEFLVISREDFIDLVEGYPHFSRGLLEILSHRLYEHVAHSQATGGAGLLTGALPDIQNL